MRPRLFASDAAEFSTLGLGSFHAVSCNVVEEINGTFELNMVMLATDPLMEQVQIGSIIAAKPNKTDPVQAFVVEHISKAINSEIEIYATHICQHRGKLIPVNKFTANGLAAAITAIRNNSLEANPFTITTDKTSSTTMKQEVPKSFRELLGGTEGSLIDTYGGELYFDNFNVKLLSRRGSDEGAQIMYGQNMTEFVHETDFSWNGSATGVKPFYYSNGTYVTSAVKYSRYADLFPYKKTVAVDFTEEFDTTPTASQLAYYAQSWINSKGLPAVNLTVAFDHFRKISNQDNVQIGDNVRILNSMYDVDLSSRIIGTDFNVLSEEYNSITIGDLKDTINDAISSLTEPGNVQKGLNIFPLGSVVMTSENNAPSFAGTWELIDKSFKAETITTNVSDYFTLNTTNMTSVSSFVLIKSEKQIAVRLRFVTKVALSETNTNFGTFSVAALGMSAMYQFNFTAQSDNGNAQLSMVLTGEGVLRCDDVITKTSGGSLAAGSQVDMYFVYAANKNHLLDSACDRFYWKRTA